MQTEWTEYYVYDVMEVVVTCIVNFKRQDSVDFQLKAEITVYCTCLSIVLG